MANLWESLYARKPAVMRCIRGAKQIDYCKRKMECDKSLFNTNKERDIDIGQSMKEVNQDIHYGTGTIKVVLQFPEETQDTFSIQKEVKAILINELQEQIKNYKS